MDYAQQILYLPFKVKEKRREKMTRVKYIYLLSANLRFVKPSEGDEILQIAKENNYLTKENEEIKPTKDYDEGNLDKNIDFNKEKLLFDIKKFNNPSNKIEETVNIALKNSDMNKKEIIQSINNLKKEKDLKIKKACHQFLKNQGIIE